MHQSQIFILFGAEHSLFHNVQKNLITSLDPVERVKKADSSLKLSESLSSVKSNYLTLLFLNVLSLMHVIAKF